MKKALVVIFTLFSSLSFAQNAELAKRLASHPSFIELNGILTKVMDMPNSEQFSKEYNSDRLGKEGNEYLIGLTGLSQETITGMNEGVIANTDKLMKDFPELKGLSKEQLDELSLQAVDLYLASGGAAFRDRKGAGHPGQDGFALANLSGPNHKHEHLDFKTCADCKREGRAQMVAGTFLGAATGSAFGPFGIWAGAVLGFWAAGEITLTCMRQYCK